MTTETQSMSARVRQKRDFGIGRVVGLTLEKREWPEVFTAHPRFSDEIFVTPGADELIYDGRPVCIDLFSGAGGFSLGFVKAGYRIIASVENNFCAHATYAFNIPKAQGIPLHCYGDILKLNGREILYNAGLQRGDVDCVIGGPPCQSFSMMGKRRIDDARDNLVNEYARIIREVQPKSFVMENVPGLQTKKYSDGKKVIDVLFEELKDAAGLDAQSLHDAYLVLEPEFKAKCLRGFFNTWVESNVRAMRAQEQNAIFQMKNYRSVA